MPPHSVPQPSVAEQSGAPNPAGAGSGTSRRTLVGVAVLLVLVGSTTVLAGAPYDLPELQLVTWTVATILIVHRPRARTRFALGLAFGAGAMGSIFSWIVPTVERFSNLPTFVPQLLLVPFAIVFGAWIGVHFALLGTIRSRAPVHWPLIGAALFVCLENWMPSIFPFAIGNTLWQRSWLFPAASVVGIAGLSFVVIAFANVVAQSWLARRSAVRTKAPAIALASVVVVLVVSAAIERSRVGAAATETDRSIRVALVQGNLDIFDDAGLVRELGPNGPAMYYRRVIVDALERSDLDAVDAVVIAEGALRDLDTAMPIARDIVKRTGAELWAGAQAAPTADRAPENIVCRFDRSGELIQRHSKNVLVPFGEYMPLESWIPALQEIQIAARLEPGPEQEIASHGEVRVGFLVCYEATRNEYVLGLFDRDVAPNLLVNVTYDGWFGDSDCPYQHRMLAASQATLLGVPLVRCATTGVSTVALPDGSSPVETELVVKPLSGREFPRPDDATIVVVDVPLVDVPTLYRRLGDITLSLSCIALFAFVATQIATRRSESSASATKVVPG